MAGVAFFVMLLGGVGAGMFAAHKNRNPAGWFVGGALLPLIAIMFLAISDSLPPPE